MLIETIPAQGLRRSTPAARRATTLADSYGGLAHGVTRWRLAAALRAAARPLGLTAMMLRLLEHYIDLTYDQDWAEGSEPVIVRPLIEIAEYLGRSERQVRNIERSLAEHGLLAFRDSGNHHRKGRRDRHTGRLVWAYGPSLAPLAARAEEIIALGEKARREIAENRRIRIALSALRGRIRAELSAANAAEIDATDLMEAFLRLPQRAPAGLSMQTLNERRNELKTLADALSARLGANDQTLETPEISAKAEIFSPRITDTPKDHSINGSMNLFHKNNFLNYDHLMPENKNSFNSAINTDSGTSNISLPLALMAAGPEITTAIKNRGIPCWRDLVDSAKEIAPFIGINQELWSETCHCIGRNGAALAIIILERAVTRSLDEEVAPVRQPAAYLRAMLARAKTNALHLDRSIRALARRCDQDMMKNQINRFNI